MGREGREVAVVIPAYNESITIGSVVLMAKKHADLVVVVNDGSKDNTSQIAKMAGATVLENDGNQGKAAALRRGFAYVSRLSFDVVVMMDGDGQHDWDDIPRLIQPILDNEADLVIGSRFLEGGAAEDIPRYRQTGQRILNGMTNVGNDKKVSDTQSGLRAISPRGMANMDFEAEGYSVESRMITHFQDRGLRIAEIPVQMRYDVPNGHKQGSITMGFGLAKSIIVNIVERRPLVLLGGLGSVFAALGALILFANIWGLGFWTAAGYSLLGAVLVGAGALLVLWGLILSNRSDVAGHSEARFGP